MKVSLFFIISGLFLVTNFSFTGTSNEITQNDKSYTSTSIDYQLAEPEFEYDLEYKNCYIESCGCWDTWSCCLDDAGSSCTKTSTDDCCTGDDS